jgi:arabinofuranosyltransferase
MPTPETSPAPQRSSTTRLPRWLLAAGLLICLLYLGAEASVLGGDFGFPLDDSWIHLQFAKNLAHGDGLSYNPGERVTGSTAPLWTALLALLFYLPGNVVLWTKALGVALHLAGLGAIWRLCRELDLSEGGAAVATGFAAATSWLVWSALSGMEVPLFVLLSVGGMVLHLRERREPNRPPLSLGIFGLAILARPEGALLLVLAVLDRLVVGFVRRAPRASGNETPDGAGAETGDALFWRLPPWRPIVAGLPLAVCALVGPLLFYKIAGGHFLPTTFSAKGANPHGLLPDLQYAGAILSIVFRAVPWMTLLAGAGVLALVERLGTRRDAGLLPALWLIALPLAYSTMSPLGRGLLAGNFGRYYFPLMPIVIVLGVLGLERAATALGARVGLGGSGTGGTGAGLPLRVLLLALLAWPTLAGLWRGSLFFAQNVGNVQDSDVRIARWLAPRLPADAVLAVNDIGAVKFFLPNRVIDLVGIASPEIRLEAAAEMRKGHDFESAMLLAIERRRPDYVIVFPTWFPAVTRDSRFRLVASLEIANNVTMGDSRLGVWATPWTQHPLRRLAGDPEPGGSIGGPPPEPPEPFEPLPSATPTASEAAPR